MSTPAIVAVGYNRPKSLLRLLQSLLSAHYDELDVTLIISIDNCGNDVVHQLALQFEWPFGPKKVVFHQKRLGLRSHILQCGDLTNEYGSVIILEDDLYVSSEFYRYVLTMLENYASDARIAGISLYSHRWHPGAHRPFLPQHSPYDVYLMQFSQSWGQCWTKDMWQVFREWYRTAQFEEKTSSSETIPHYIAQWPESSWLKYHIKYTSETNRYFVYPYLSLTTNFCDVGTHNLRVDSTYQVELQSQQMAFRIPPNGSEVCYDCYFENMKLSIQGISKEELSVDLYGLRSSENLKRFVLTTSDLSYRVIAQYGLRLRPHENNVIQQINGSEIKLYDRSVKESLKEPSETIKFLTIMNYDLKSLTLRGLIVYLRKMVTNRMWSKVCSILLRK